MALEQPHAILPYIPPRTSSHRHSSSHQTAILFPDDEAHPSTDGPSSPPRPRSSKRPMSSTITTSPSSHAQGKLPAGAGAARFPFKAKSAYFSSSHSEFQASVGASRTSITPSSPPRQRAKSNSNPFPTSGIEGGGPFEPSRTFGDHIIHGRRASWSAEKERILLGPFDYLYGHPGKDIRAQLIAAFNAWLRVPEDSLAIITKVIGMLHTASLLVDDVEDSSLLRRGAPVAHAIFGTAQTLNSANYVYFLALQQLTRLPNAALSISIFTEELLNLHRGQGMDLYWRDTLTCPTEEDYLEMVSNKTGGLFRLAIKLMQAESPMKGIIDCVPLVSTIGLLFQILDDLLNLSSPTYTQRKGLCEDLTEGKFSFPVIHGIRADPDNLVLLNILKQKTNDEEVKRYAVQYMERMGTFRYTREVLKVLEGKALGLVGALEKQIGGEEGKQGAEGIKGILGKLKAL